MTFSTSFRDSTVSNDPRGQTRGDITLSSDWQKHHIIPVGVAGNSPLLARLAAESRTEAAGNIVRR